MRKLLSILFAGAVLTAPVVARAQVATDYPTRPIRLVVGFAPGGATDTLARLLTGALGAELGQSIYVENIAGASGLLGWRNVAGSTPDGYSLLMAENAVAIRPGFKDMTPTFDPVTQLDAVASVAHSPLALCVADNVPVSNVKELIALSRKSEKKLNFASAGNGSVAQLVWEVIKDGAKIDAVDVPYRGGGPAMAAIIAGQVEIITASSQVRSLWSRTSESRPLRSPASNAPRPCRMCRHWRRPASSMPTSIFSSGSACSARKACRPT